MKYFPSEFNEMFSSLCGFHTVRDFQGRALAEEETLEVVRSHAEAMETVQELSLQTGKGPESQGQLPEWR